MQKSGIALTTCTFLSACASTPNVTYSYYPVQSVTILSITQTVGCTADMQTLVTVYSVDATTSYTADTTKEPFLLPIKSLDGTFSDANIKATFTEDGRLQTINSTTTGQGENLIKAAVILATATVGLAGGGENAATSSPETACKAIKARGGDNPVSLTYAKHVSLANYAAPKYEALNLLSNDPGLYNALKAYLPQVGVQIHALKNTSSVAGYTTDQRDDIVNLTLQQTGNVQLDFKAGGNIIATSYVIVPTETTYSLPIPKAAWFGAQTFSLTLASSGAITSIEYSKTAGATGALNALSATTTAATPSSAAEKAAETKAKADLIAEQQRLARCQADPAQCQ